MAKYLAAALVACLYIIGSTWLVQREGAAYREGLRLAGGDLPPVAPEPARAPRIELPLPVPPPIALVSPTRPVMEPMPTPAPAPAPSLVPMPAPAPTLPVPVPVSSLSVAAPAAPPVATETRVPTWADSLNLSRLSIEDERRLGRDLNAMILTYNQRLASGPYLQRVVETARPILDARTRKELDYTFTILNTNAVTAFSHPGGYIYIGRGLFDLIGEEEDYALQFVLAHEIAHVDLKHAIKCLEKVDPAERKRGPGLLEQFYLLISFAYPDAQEFEADAWAYRQMIRLDRTRREGLAFLRKFQGYASAHGFNDGRMPPATDEKAPAVENHFRAQPAAWDRLGRLKELSAKIAPPAPSAPK